MNLINYAKRSFVADICGERGVRGKVQVQENNVYLCQDRIAGACCRNRLGYFYSYHINRGTEYDLRENSVYDFKIID